MRRNCLYSRLPIYFAVLSIPLLYIPVFGYLVMNGIIAIVITLIIFKKLRVKVWLKIWFITYGLALGAYIVAFCCCLSTEMGVPSEPSVFNPIETQIQKREMIAQLMVYTGVILSSVLLFLSNLFGTFTLFFRKEERFRIWQRILFSAIFTAVNAPYLFLLVSSEALEKMGFPYYYNVF